MTQVPTPTPADLNKDDWEKKFFEKHNITDEKEKTIIRGRATVLAYDRAKAKAELEESTPRPSGDKKWYED